MNNQTDIILNEIIGDLNRRIRQEEIGVQTNQGKIQGLKEAVEIVQSKRKKPDLSGVQPASDQPMTKNVS